ncbi:type I restriction enzyme, S subunit [Fibrobacter intestinalis]|uniref:Type I restriction enzyme, S subunit n=1 Tax=Fibrobacter intestinalis TaxID=28122 RepID=A0A1T4MTW3_9BACT|nr:type I restriction enzyme S subunit [Fibrobacter sp. NR9]SJZ70341.1 type I restriction enzyme, S subunit [Fibrobacter intestinalis]
MRKQASKQASKQAVISLYQYVFGYAVVQLGDVAKYSDTRIKNSELLPFTYVSVENLLQQKQGVEFSDKIPEGNNSIEYKKDDILIGNIRPYLKKIWKADRNGGTNGDVLTIRIIDECKDVITPNYLYYLLSSDDFFNYDMQFAKGAKMPRGSKEDVMNFEFSVPPLAEQERIVKILDRFDSLCNDIASGLPAEIEARKKQYEYYRDKLLSFRT